MRALKISVISVSILFSGCTLFLGEPDRRVERFSDWELCTELADKTFKYHSEWHWAIANEIKGRDLESSDRCKSTYSARMNRFMAKSKTKPMSFDDALNHDFN
ncbi:hypothetical protein GCM10027180_33470 [Microbulbifer echini]